jgi:hypothetical protein
MPIPPIAGNVTASFAAPSYDGRLDVAAQQASPIPRLGALPARRKKLRGPAGRASLGPAQPVG